MKSYCYYVLSVRELWQQILTDKHLHIKNMKTIDEIRSLLTNKEIQKANIYILDLV